MGKQIPTKLKEPVAAVQPVARIMVVDDDRDFLRLLGFRLEQDGYEVKGVDSARTALTELPEFNPDLVIADLRFGSRDDMDGIELISRLQQRRPGLPVLLLTAYGQIPDAVSATQCGAFNVLSKPVDHSELRRCLRDALRLSGATEISADWRSEIVTRSPVMEELLKKARRIAPTGHAVLITGESGSGKEVMARAIHKASGRSGPFVAFNCAAIPGELLESELFGYQKGAFTGATQRHAGLFQQAHGGTLLLDEIGEMPAALQAKLLRVVEDRQVRPLGTSQPVSVDVRIISATNRNLSKAIESGAFRDDLYYRLNVVTLELPRLVDRIEDIPALANHRLRQNAHSAQDAVKSFSPEAMEQLLSHDWAGNVRQLFNVVDQVSALSTSPILSAELVQNALGVQSVNMSSLTEARRQFVREYLIQMLVAAEGSITQAARLAGRNRSDFYKLLAKHDIDPAIYKSRRTCTPARQRRQWLS